MRCLHGVFAASALVIATSAGAAFTPVNPLGAGSGAERCLAGPVCSGGSYNGARSILSLYAADLGLSPGALVRVDDSADRLWGTVQGEQAQIRSVARYAGDNSVAGITGASAGSLNVISGVLANSRVGLFAPAQQFGDVRGGDIVAAGPWSVFSTMDPFAFVLWNQSSGLRLSSDTALPGYSNSGAAQDWMVTYRVPGQNRYLIAWEDRRSIGGNGLPNDYDYNDYVFEVRGVTPYVFGEESLSAVPLPGALGLLLAGLLAIGSGGVRRPSKESRIPA